MRILGRVQTWWARQPDVFMVEPPVASIAARLGAAEYEFHSIVRDVAAVMLDGPPRTISLPSDHL